MTSTPRGVAVLTGGSNGIGAAIAARLTDDGFRVAIFDLVPPEHPMAIPGPTHFTVDISDGDAVREAMTRVRTEMGPPSCVVHCAAYQTVASFTALEETAWARTFRVNVDGAFHLVRAALPDLQAATHPRIIVVTSSSLYAPPPAMVHYVASKGALVGFVRALAVELGPAGITVNAVAPGLTRTEHALASIPEQHFELVRSRQALKRSGEPADIAGAVSYLASPDASFVTGQTLLVDGGESHL